jgi:tetratricopeptide (TPR) repeat protein
MWIAAIVAVLLAGAAAAWWWTRVPPDATNAEVAARPLDRLLLLPVSVPGGAGADSAARVAGADALLRDALSAVPGFAVVDTERTVQALRQLDAAGAAAADPAALRGVAAASRVLVPKLVREGERWRVRATLHGDGAAAAALDGAPADDPVQAMREWAMSRQFSGGLGLEAPPTFALPAGVALQAHGAALLARREDRLPQAYEQARAAAEAAPEAPYLWLSYAGIAQAIGEDDAAFEALERGLAGAGKDPTRLRHRLVAARALLEGDSPAAVAEWRALLQATPDDTFAELNLARAQGAGGDFGAAVETLQGLVARDPQDPRAWYELGKFSILQGQARRAVDEYLVRALVLFKRSGDGHGEAETVNALGIGYARLGQTADAIEQYRKAVELRHAIGNRRGEATSLRNLGTALTLAGRFDEAAGSLAQARILHAGLDDRAGLAAVENELGLLAEERGDYPAALEAFRRALQAWQRLEDPLGIAQAHDDIGYAHFQLGAYDNAQVYLERAADEYEALGDRTGSIRAQQELGLLALSRGRWQRARELLQASLARAEQGQMPEEAAVGRRHLAELALWQGDLAEAMSQAGRAERLFAQREDARGRSDAALLRVQALLAMHADAAAAKALDALEPLLGEVSVEQRAIAAAARAQLAMREGDGPSAARARAEAASLAKSSGIRALELQVALLDPAARGLDAATATLGHAGLRLRWLGRTMETAMAEGNAGVAAQAYREARVLLREGDFVDAHRLHALGARALAATGDDAGARHAASQSATARSRLRAKVPEEQRSAFDAAFPDPAAAAAPVAPAPRPAPVPGKDRA